MLKGRWAALLCLAATGCAHGADAGADWISLFDGKTLNAWTPKISGYALGDDPMRTFRAEDGVIRVSYDQYGGGFKKRFGHLAYRTPFGSYRLRGEYRMVGQSLPDVESWQQSNSGVMLYGQPPATMGKDQSFPVSIEVQLLGASRQDPAPTANLCTPGTNVLIGGKLETTHCINSTSPIIPNGRWTRFEVTVDPNGNFTHLVDGVAVMTYGGAQYDPTDPDAQKLIEAAGGKLEISNGYIYLQSEGHPVEFRSLELQILK